MIRFVIALLLFVAQASAAAPAKRIVSLAPHVTELLFAAGAGDRIVGTVSYSDYPEAARNLPRVGDFHQLDLERIIALKPDLVVAWESGNGVRVIERLRDLGLNLHVTEPRRLADIPETLETLGALAGTEAVAGAAAARFRERLSRLASRYGGRPTVKVFYEVWNRPLMTVGGRHLISDVIATCGGRNIFERLDALAPTVALDAVLAADPEVIVASGMDEARPEWLDDWRRWPGLTAVRRGQLHFIPPDLLQRPTPRLLEGAERFCRALEQARQSR